jgi:hypothetical protein
MAMLARLRGTLPPALSSHETKAKAKIKERLPLSSAFAAQSRHDASAHSLLELRKAKARLPLLRPSNGHQTAIHLVHMLTYLVYYNTACYKQHERSGSVPWSTALLRLPHMPSTLYFSRARPGNTPAGVVRLWHRPGCIHVACVAAYAMMPKRYHGLALALGLSLGLRPALSGI